MQENSNSNENSETYNDTKKKEVPNKSFDKDPIRKQKEFKVVLEFFVKTMYVNLGLN
eukprot:COSAG01_NODE_216_length_21695_cov_83.368772_18_plen_57_part_00